MTRRRVKETIASTARLTGMMSLSSVWQKSGSPPGNFAILMYHRVLEDLSDPLNFVQPGMAVSADTFRKQLEFLSSKYRIVPLPDMVRILKSRHKKAGKFASITFDDGWKDNITVACPILKQMSIPATVYLTTDFIETGRTFWFLRLTRLLSSFNPDISDLANRIVQLASEDGMPMDIDPNELTDASGVLDIESVMLKVKHLSPDSIDRLLDELEQSLHAEGRDKLADLIMSWEDARAVDPNTISFGSHGCSHKILTHLNDETARYELTRSKEIIEDRLDCQVDSFAYPNGNNDERIRCLTADAGYSHAVATKDLPPPRKLDLYRLQRISMHEGLTESSSGGFSKDLFAAALARLFG